MKMVELIEEARAYAEAHSRDPSTKVGGILLVGPRGLKVHGHNSFAFLSEPQHASRGERYADVVHAEEVCLTTAGADQCRGATYVGSHEPCDRCYRRLGWAGVSVVIFPPTSPDRRERWGCDDGRRLYEAAGGVAMEVSE